MQGVGTTPSCIMQSDLCKAILENIVRSSSMDITLDDVLTILDEPYNNVKELDALNQELFQLWMADKETVSDWGICLSRHVQVLAASFPDHFPPDHVAELKRDCFYDRLPKWLKAMVAYLKVGQQVRMYSDYLRAALEAEKEDSIELPWGPRAQTTDGPLKPRTTSFFPLRKLKGNQPLLKKPPVHLAHLEAEDASNDEDPESDDPSRFEGVTEEFMVHLAMAVKDAQADEKHCYHCSSLGTFHLQLPTCKDFQRKETVKQEGGDGINKGSLDPSGNDQCHEELPDRGSQGIKTTLQTPFLNPDPFHQWYGAKNIARVRINGKSCMALLDNGVQINTIMPKYINDHSLQVVPIPNLIGLKSPAWGWAMSTPDHWAIS